MKHYAQIHFREPVTVPWAPNVQAGALTTKPFHSFRVENASPASVSGIGVVRSIVLDEATGIVALTNDHGTSEVAFCNAFGAFPMAEPEKKTARKPAEAKVA